MTAEVAVIFPGIVLILALTSAASMLGVAQLRTADAAHAVARSILREGEDAHVGSIVSRVAGEHSIAEVVTTGEWVEVTVTTQVQSPGGILPIPEVSASARVPVEHVS